MNFFTTNVNLSQFYRKYKVLQGYIKNPNLMKIGQGRVLAFTVKKDSQNGRHIDMEVKYTVY